MQSAGVSSGEGSTWKVAEFLSMCGRPKEFGSAKPPPQSYPPSKFDGLTTSISMTSQYAIYWGDADCLFLADALSRMPQYNSTRE